MGLEIRMPEINGTTAAEQLYQIRAYLRELAEQLSQLPEPAEVLEPETRQADDTAERLREEFRDACGEVRRELTAEMDAAEQALQLTDSDLLRQLRMLAAAQAELAETARCIRLTDEGVEFGREKDGNFHRAAVLTGDRVTLYDAGGAQAAILENGILKSCRAEADSLTAPHMSTTAIHLGGYTLQAAGDGHLGIG